MAKQFPERPRSICARRAPVLPDQPRQLLHALSEFARLSRNGEPLLFLKLVRTADFEPVGDMRAVRMAMNFDDVVHAQRPDVCAELSIQLL